CGRCLTGGGRPPSSPARGAPPAAPTPRAGAAPGTARAAQGVWEVWEAWRSHVHVEIVAELRLELLARLVEMGFDGVDRDLQDVRDLAVAEVLDAQQHAAPHLRRQVLE